MATPDVRVRLSAEGTAEVIAALRKVQAESAAAAGKGVGAFKAFNSVIASTKTLLASLGFAIGITALTTMAKRVADFAGNMREAAQRVGTTTERVSALAHAARNAGSSLQQLEAATGILNKNIAEGSDKFVKALDAIGLSVKDFQGLDTAQRLGLIAEKFATLKTSGEKSALAMAIFGRQGRALIPLLNEMADGLEGLENRARLLGVVISDEAAAALDEMTDSLEDLKTAAVVVASQFLLGLAPDIKRALDSMTKDFAAGSSAAEIWGRRTGEAVDLVGTGFIELADDVATAVKQLAQFAKVVAEGPQAAGEAIAKIVALEVELEKRQQDRIKGLDARQREREGGPPFAPREAVTGATDLGDLDLSATDAADKVETLRAKLAAVNEELIALGAVNIATPIGDNVEELRASLRAAEDQLKKLKEATENFERRRVAGTISSVDVEMATQGVDNLVESVDEIGPAFNDAQRDIDQFAADTVRAAEEAAIALEQVKLREEQVKFAALDLAQSGLAGFFEEGTDSLEGFARALRRFASELLAAEVIAAAGRIFRSPGSFGGGGDGFSTISDFVNVAGGGLVTGPGTGTSDSIPAWVSNKEYIEPAHAVAKPGMLQHLEAIRRGQWEPPRFAEGGLVAFARGLSIPPIAQAVGVSRFAEGGLVGGGGGGGAARLESSLTVGLDKGLVLQQLDSPEGQRIVIKALTENSRTVQRIVQ